MSPAEITAPASNAAFLHALGPELEDLADPEKAPGMAAYMKSAMPFLGFPAPLVRKTVRSLAKDHPFDGAGQLLNTVMELWSDAAYREERYAAIMLTDSRIGRGELGLLPFYVLVIEQGQWWDYVDAVAPRICELLQADRELMEPLLRQWSVHENFWFRRSAIIAQLPAKSATDVVLLADVIRANLGQREFFIRKAIGWALRQYARTDPDWVRTFVAEHHEQLSPLSRREALKHL